MEAVDVPARKKTIDTIHFGTDGWRAIIDEDFTTASLARVIDATARVFLEEHTRAQAAPKPRIIIGYDCRKDAGRFAAFAGAIMAAHGFEVLLSESYCPTPALCFSVAHNHEALGGIMLTSSHNPAEYLGVKLRMADGGASPASFTDRVEAALRDELPSSYEHACSVMPLAHNGTPEKPSKPLEQAPELIFTDIMTPYLDELVACVDAEVIAQAGLRIVLDALYGAGRGYLARTLRRLGVSDLVEVNADNDPSFAGLHPEPIFPWIQAGADKTAELAYDACFITDGDADRIAALDSEGSFVSPHRILALIVAHLVEHKQRKGRVVRTLSGSNLVKRQCERLNLELTTTPIGFKWIYEEMLAGDVLIGGEESGGIGIPSHVRERDGLLMALLLTELMAHTKKPLKQLVSELLAQLGNFDYARRDLQLSAAQKESFLQQHVHAQNTAAAYAPVFSALGEEITSIDYRDGLYVGFKSDAWLLMRPSGTEPLVRVYAEATEAARVEALLDVGCALVRGNATGEATGDLC